MRAVQGPSVTQIVTQFRGCVTLDRRSSIELRRSALICAALSARRWDAACVLALDRATRLLSSAGDAALARSRWAGLRCQA
jgi:hypothetical protein